MTWFLFRDIYWVSLYILNILLETVVHADVREEGKVEVVYYQVEHTAGRLNCYYKTNLTGWVDFGNKSTYHSGYAECTGLSKGNFNYDIKLEVKSGGEILETYWTDQNTAISKGLHPAAGKIHKTALTNSRI